MSSVIHYEGTVDACVDAEFGDFSSFHAFGKVFIDVNLQSR
jgi:hypothetical protein